MDNDSSKNIDQQWPGTKGFDEARYYKDEIHSLGIEHSDEKLKNTVIEALKRDQDSHSGSVFVEVNNGHVTLSGENLDLVRLRSLIRGLSGVKDISFN